VKSGNNGLKLFNQYGIEIDPNKNTVGRHLRRHVIKLVSSSMHAGNSLKQRNGLKFKIVNNIKLIISLFQNSEISVLYFIDIFL
jgi:hypothetical protein